MNSDGDSDVSISDAASVSSSDSEDSTMGRTSQRPPTTSHTFKAHQKQLRKIERDRDESKAKHAQALSQLEKLRQSNAKLRKQITGLKKSIKDLEERPVDALLPRAVAVPPRPALKLPTNSTPNGVDGHSAETGFSFGKGSTEALVQLYRNLFDQRPTNVLASLFGAEKDVEQSIHLMIVTIIYSAYDKAKEKADEFRNGVLKTLHVPSTTTDPVEGLEQFVWTFLQANHTLPSLFDPQKAAREMIQEFNMPKALLGFVTNCLALFWKFVVSSPRLKLEEEHVEFNPLTDEAFKFGGGVDTDIDVQSASGRPISIYVWPALTQQSPSGPKTHTKNKVFLTPIASPPLKDAPVASS